MRVKNQKDFLAGLLFMAVGLAFAWGATHYPIGRGAHMGPGYFPRILGGVMAVLGVIVAGIGFLLGTFGGSLLAAINRAIKAADLWALIRQRFGGGNPP